MYNCLFYIKKVDDFSAKYFKNKRFPVLKKKKKKKKEQDV